jgi:predicted amidohydrolase
MAGWAERAKAEGAELVAFPELCIPGICKDERLASVTETLDGPSAAFVRALASRLGQHTGRMRWKTHDQMRDDFYGYVPGLARDNRFWALFVNQSGRPHECLDFAGPSFVSDPSGRVVAETHDGSEQLVLATLS